MVKNKIEYIISLCLKVQENTDGYIDATNFKEDKFCERKKGPTVFVQFSGHVSLLVIEIHEEGWEPFRNSDAKYEFNLSQEIDEEVFEECRDYLLSMLDRVEETK